jgi:hypothetical protein
LRRAMSLLLDDGTCGFMTVWGAWQHGLLGAGMAWHGGLAHSECIRVPTAVRVRMVHQSLGPGSLPWIRASRPIMVHPRRKDDRGRLGTTIGRWIVSSVSVCFRPPSRPPDLEFITILVIHVSSGLGSMPQSNRTPCSLFSSCLFVFLCSTSVPAHPRPGRAMPSSRISYLLCPNYIQRREASTSFPCHDVRRRQPVSRLAS